MSGEGIGKSPQEIIVTEKLKEHFRMLIQSAGGNTKLANLQFDRMDTEYHRGDGRSYHNIFHIAKVDDILNKHQHLARNFIPLSLAGKGHDVIYIPGSDTNEEDSANYMRGSLSVLSVPRPIIEETTRLILITKDHKTTDDDVDGKLLIDADYAIFASPADEYDAYVDGIWQEYVYSGKIPRELFIKGRLRLVEGWLNQDRLFLTDQIRKELQPLAKENLQREQLRLTA